ncbi:MAG: hypothetical protein KatS3mg105_3270 [Gemmatales bacterium]|nr:MAG: hypothetical protein KatS3mg105_3270 [Gemmatales bacterium]
MLSKPWSNAYRRRLRSEIVTCFTWAAREGGLIEKSPYYRSRALKLPVVPRRAATLREYVLLMRFGSRPLKLALMLLARSARTCEMRAVRWRDVDWENRVIELRQHKTSRSTGKSRLIGLDPVMYRLLRRRWERRKSDDEHIFTNSRGEPWTADSFSRNLRRTAKRLGLRVTGYMFRHLWASLAETRGLSDREIATGLGHTNTSLVHYYSKARCEKRHVRRIAEKVFAKRFG